MNKRPQAGSDRQLFPMRGASVLKTLLLVPVALVLVIALAFAFFEGRKAYWDYRVRAMCEKDGGDTVYEKVLISRDQFQVWGGIGDSLGIPHESYNRLDIPFFRRTKDETLHDWNPQVMRMETVVIRRSDRKILGKHVYYFRRGGDFPTWAHESSFGCMKAALPIDKGVFIIGKQFK